MKHIARLILKIFGWKLKGGLPADKKAVVISVPHTSIMDFIWGKLTFISQGVPTYILMKKEFFFFPLGPILKALNHKRQMQMKRIFMKFTKLQQKKAFHPVTGEKK